MDITTKASLINQTMPVMPRISSEITIWLIPCYSICFLLLPAIYWWPAPIWDMLVSFLRMPIILVGTYLRHFVFGELTSIDKGHTIKITKPNTRADAMYEPAEKIVDVAMTEDKSSNGSLLTEHEDVPFGSQPK
uniref:Uncharacterized protein n=1 Tax=Glossina austeni TaxID=7395 RepID=A0A1A9UGI5_GLOAU